MSLDLLPQNIIPWPRDEKAFFCFILTEVKSCKLPLLFSALHRQFYLENKPLKFIVCVLQILRSH